MKIKDEIRLMIHAGVRLPAESLRLWRPLGLLLGIGGVITGGLLVYGLATDTVLASMTRDPVSVLRGPGTTGLLSFAGLLVWGVLIGTCFAGWRAARLRDNMRSAPRAGFFLWAGIGAFVLGFDDAFMVHERLMPGVLGVRETFVFLTYLIGMAAWAGWYRRVLIASELPILCAGFGLLGGSLVVDKIFSHGIRSSFYEDALKFMGMVCGLGYFWRAVGMELRTTASDGPRNASGVGKVDPTDLGTSSAASEEQEAPVIEVVNSLTEQASADAAGSSDRADRS